MAKAWHGTAMRANRFDFLRLVFASTVFIYHLIVLAVLDVNGLWEPRLAALAELSIQGFFIISGALVYGSWERSHSIADYAGKRFRRLYPAYAVIIVFPSLIALAQGGAVDAVMRYLGANLVFANFLAPTLPGLFESQRFEEVNGALWTLKIEVMFYVSLVILGPVTIWLKRRSPRILFAFFIAIYFASELWRLVFETMAVERGELFFAQIARQLPGQAAFFTTGIALWIWRDWTLQNLRAVSRLGLVLLAVSLTVPELDFLCAVGLTGAIAGLAWGRGPAIPAAKFGDISYGLYICHFPIVQALIAAGLFAANPILGAALSVTLVLLASFALWYFVERPSLRPDSHYRSG
ncbi:MAG: acyltransferase [Pseudomonadota bacterium]